MCVDLPLRRGSSTQSRASSTAGVRCPALEPPTARSEPSSLWPAGQVGKRPLLVLVRRRRVRHAAARAGPRSEPARTRPIGVVLPLDGPASPLAFAPLDGAQQTCPPPRPDRPLPLSHGGRAACRRAAPHRRPARRQAQAKGAPPPPPPPPPPPHTHTPHTHTHTHTPNPTHSAPHASARAGAPLHAAPPLARRTEVARLRRGRLLEADRAAPLPLSHRVPTDESLWNRRTAQYLFLVGAAFANSLDLRAGGADPAVVASSPVFVVSTLALLGSWQACLVAGEGGLGAGHVRHASNGATPVGPSSFRWSRRGCDGTGQLRPPPATLAASPRGPSAGTPP